MGKKSKAEVGVELSDAASFQDETLDKHGKKKARKKLKKGKHKALSACSRCKLTHQEALEVTFLSDKEMEVAVLLYESMDQDPQIGGLGAEELARLVPFDNGFSWRFIRVFSERGDHTINLDEFLDMLSYLSPAAPLACKLQMFFCVLDYNEDGAICNDDILHYMVDALGPEQVETFMVPDEVDETEVVDTVEGEAPVERVPLRRFAFNILKECDADDGDDMDYDEFTAAMSEHSDIAQHLRCAAAACCCRLLLVPVLVLVLVLLVAA